MSTDKTKLRVEAVLQRVAEGMSTEADAEFLAQLLEKLAPNLVKGYFEEKSAR